MAKVYDAIIIGGGFFGLNIASYLRTELRQKNVLILEKESDFMQRASYNNQARVHGGYHYPRSLLTGLRSQINFPRFVKEYDSAIVSDFDKYYAIAHNFSKVSARQFKLFCERIGADIVPASKQVEGLFDGQLIEKVFAVKEYAFNAKTLKQLLLKKLTFEGVSLQTSVAVSKVTEDKGHLSVHTEDGKVYETKAVFNCTYSSINTLNKNSNIPTLPFKYELAELSLIELPPVLEGKSVTIMCGPFFSFMPFPDRQGLHTLSHVRYTPHSEWVDQHDGQQNSHDDPDVTNRVSHFKQMVSDAARYLPVLSDSLYKGSLWETKTILQQSEHDDSRPILFRRNHGLQGYHCVLGGKLDNIYDVFHELDVMYAKA